MNDKEYIEVLMETEGKQILKELNLNGKHSEVSVDDRGVFVILDPIGLEYGDYSFLLHTRELNTHNFNYKKDVYNTLKTLIIKKMGEYNQEDAIKEFSKEDYVENKEDIERDVKKAYDIYSKIYNKEKKEAKERIYRLINGRSGGGKTFMNSVLFKPESVYIANNILKDMNLEYIR